MCSDALHTHFLMMSLPLIYICTFMSLAWERSKKKLYSNCIFHTTASVLYGKKQYSDWPIQHSGQSRGIKNLIKGGITIDRVNNISVNNSNVVLNVSRYYSSLLSALFYSTHPEKLVDMASPPAQYDW